MARGVGDLGPAEAESPTLFCSWAIRLAILALRKLNRQPYLVYLIYSATFSLIMLHIKILFKGYLTVSQTFFSHVIFHHFLAL